MTLRSPLVGLYMIMAVSLLDQCHLLLSFVLLFIICDRKLYLQLAVASQKVALTSGPHLYHQCEDLIRKELIKLNVTELEKETKLTRVFQGDDGGASTFFLKNETSTDKPLFSWKSINLTAIEDVILIGVNESGLGSLEDYVPYGWMAGTFLTMKKANRSIVKRDPSEELKVDYYALVAYVRKDSKKGNNLELEWDRWSQYTVTKLLHRAHAFEAAHDFNVKTFLCAYGSCSCSVCDCKPKKTNVTGKAIGSGKMETSTSKDIYKKGSITVAPGRVPGTTKKSFGSGTTKKSSGSGTTKKPSVTTANTRTTVKTKESLGTGTKPYIETTPRTMESSMAKSNEEIPPEGEESTEIQLITPKSEESSETMDKGAAFLKLVEPPGTEVDGVSISSQETPEIERTANATAYSKNGKAHAISLSDGNAYSEAISTRKHAISESSSKMGQSTTYSSGFSEVHSDSTSHTGDAKSFSKTKDGYAQAASQSRGGDIASAAMKEGESEEEYKFDDANNNSTEDEEVNIDPESLVKDTDKAFNEANQRFQRHKSPKQKRSVNNKCQMESETEENLTIEEWKLLLNKEQAIKSDPKTKAQPTDPIFLYHSPLRFGIDVEVGVNTSVLITSALPGYTAPQESCCGLILNSSSIVGQFLRKFRQECNPELQSQVYRLEKFFNDTNLAKLMQTKKLNPNQILDMMPMIFLKLFRNQTIRKSLPTIGALYKNSTSDDINLITILAIHAAHYTTGEGYLHKVKILKRLSTNVRTVLTGILLESKRCQNETQLCSKMLVSRLESEQRLIIGLYLFLKFADSRFALFAYKEPVNYFTDFMKIHKNSIDLLAECKSRRISSISAWYKTA